MGAGERAFDQCMMRRQLQEALSQGNGPSCWAAVDFAPSCRTANVTSTRAGPFYVRLISFRGGYYVFMNCNKHFAGGHHETYHARDDEFTIIWVHQGPNAAGLWLRGEELELDFWSPPPPPSPSDSYDSTSLHDLT
eukprot:scaffold125613_cov35-Tisochrysis_lutea.AAC.1